MKGREMCRLLKIPLPGYLAFAFEDLEAQGLQFAVHFGTMNAVQMATDRWLQALDRNEVR